MCLICVEFQKSRMTLPEARRAFSEMVDGMSQQHATEVRKMLDEAQAILDERDCS